MMHDADGISVELYGQVELQYVNDKEKGEDAIIDIDEANFGVQAGYDINEDFTAIGVVSFDASDDDSDNSNAVLDDAYVGFTSEKYGTFTVGQQVTIFDDAGIGSDKEFGLASFYDQTDNGEQVIKYTIDKGTVYGGVAYLLDDGESDDGLSAIDGKIGVRFEGVDLTAFYGRGELAETAGGGDVTNLNLEARYTIGDVTLAAAYASLNTDSTLTIDEDNLGDLDNFGLAATYQLGKAQFATGWSLTDADNLDDKINTYFVNASYAFSSNVSSYVEIGGDDIDDSELGYVAGMSVTF
jgi:predicted porin